MLAVGGESRREAAAAALPEGSRAASCATFLCVSRVSLGGALKRVYAKAPGIEELSMYDIL